MQTRSLDAMAPRYRRDHLLRRAHAVAARNWLVLSPAALVLIAVIELLPARGPAWMQLPLLSLALLHGAGIWHALARQRAAPRAVPTDHVLAIHALAVAGCVAFACLWTAAVLIMPLLPVPLLQDFLIPSLIYCGVLIAPLRVGALLYTLLVTAGVMLHAEGGPGPHTP